MTKERVWAVAIGRNEGNRLARCLSSLHDRVEQVVYVDSGSTDGSAAVAERFQAEVVHLETHQPFTAARARNAGLERALRHSSPPDFVQFIDGDCVMQPTWIAEAANFLACHPDVAVACGRRRELHPEASLWNRLIDCEWDTPLGETRACGGDALMRVTALREVGGFNPTLIAGEEPELCVRLRQAGWRIWRLDAEMTLHDAAMTRFSQWWRRSRRAGHAFAEGVALHGASPERHKVAEMSRALLWGAGVPLVACLGTLFTPWALLVLLAWPAQVLRLSWRRVGMTRAVFLTIGKVPEAIGVGEYWLRRLGGRRAGLIEYK